MSPLRKRRSRLWAAAAIFSLGIQQGAAAVPMPRGGDGGAGRMAGPMLLAAADEPESKGGKKSRTESDLPKEEFRKRGAELGNYVYEVFDPKAKDPLADLDAPARPGGSGKIWWITGGAVGLIGAGVAGYFLLAPGPDKVIIRYLDYCDSGNCNPRR